LPEGRYGPPSPKLHFEHQPVRFGVGYDKGLANDVSTLYVCKAGFKLTSCDEFLRQSNLVVEG
jgi:hypothetical protein